MVTLYDRIWTRGPNSNIVHFLILIAHKISIFVRIMSSKLLWVKKQYRLYIRKSLPMIGRPVNIYWPFFKNYVRIRAPYVTQVSWLRNDINKDQIPRSVLRLFDNVYIAWTNELLWITADRNSQRQESFNNTDHHGPLKLPVYTVESVGR